MNEFDNNSFNSDNNQKRPDYYQPQQGSSDNTAFNGTYYTPPKSENAENGSYHYSYSDNRQSAYGSQGYYSSDDNQPSGDNEPPKKNKTGKIIAIIVCACVLIACVGLVVAGVNYIGSDSGTSSDTDSQAQNDTASVADSEDVPLIDSDNNYTVAGVADAAMESCVGITVYTQQSEAYNYFYNYGQGSSSSTDPTVSGEGSGVLMGEQDGKTYVMTCAHVISDGDSFTVTLNDGTELEAQMVGYDSQTDIGVLSVDKTGLKIAEFADSDNLVVGEQVVAIGCPGGLEFMNSVTSGYISALDRPVSSSIGYDNECIQTDAAINPGNSGGALFNMQGQVIGINSSKIASTEYEGMGFAVPSSTAVATANSLIKVGYVEGRAKIGIQYSPISSFSNSSTIIKALEQEGFEDAQGTMVINSVDSSSDLSSKNIQQYDMIVAVNGNTMTSTDVMTSILADSAPGDTITLTIARIENNSINTFEVECTLIEDKGNN